MSKKVDIQSGKVFIEHNGTIVSLLLEEIAQSGTFSESGSRKTLVFFSIQLGHYTINYVTEIQCTLKNKSLNKYLNVKEVIQSQPQYLKVKSLSNCIYLI